MPPTKQTPEARTLAELQDALARGEQISNGELIVAADEVRAAIIRADASAEAAKRAAEATEQARLDRINELFEHVITHAHREFNDRTEARTEHLRSTVVGVINAFVKSVNEDHAATLAPLAVEQRALGAPLWQQGVVGVDPRVTVHETITAALNQLDWTGVAA